MSTYAVNGTGFESFTAAVAAAKAAGAEVIEVTTGIRRWTPAPKKVAKVRHVFIRDDGSEVEFSRCKR